MIRCLDIYRRAGFGVASSVIVCARVRTHLRAWFARIIAP